MTKLYALLLDRRSDRSFELAEELERQGCSALAWPETAPDPETAFVEVHPDVVIAGADSVDPELLDRLRRAGEAHRCPVVVFVEESDAETTHAAVRAGVSAYVVGGLAPARLRAVIDVAIARFRELEGLKKELREARSSLSDRKLVERAKGILMKNRGLREEEAYALLRKTAMNRNLKLSEVARRVLEMSDLL